MKALFAAAVAATLALPALAQQLPSEQERAENREKLQETLPSADERAQNREAVTKGAANATLTTKVKSALAADTGLKTITGIDVDSENGVVTLKGKVSSADHRKHAEQVAKKVDGVKRVKNQLKVEKS